jgi:hypothetical protein
MGHVVAQADWQTVHRKSGISDRGINLSRAQRCPVQIDLQIPSDLVAVTLHCDRTRKCAFA